jgi:aryl-alcohol dehydrogenase-like predicted oxidoreductase
MHYKLLGPTGLRVSELCLGTMTFGEEWGWGASLEECGKLFNAYLDHGGNFIDTANYYTNGSSETIVGELSKGIRDRLVLATKYTLNTDPEKNINAGGNHRKNMVRAVEHSLRRLQTDYIDLYWVHIWDKATPIDEILRGLDDLVSSGKIVYTGFSDVPAWVFAKGNALAESLGWNKFAALQLEYNLLERGIERELLPLAKHDDLALLAWSPLAMGLLSGKYRSANDKGQSGRADLVDARLTERNIAIINTLVEVAAELGASPAAIALRWLQHQYHQVIPILGARKLDQLLDNLKSIQYELSESQLKRLDEASKIELGFPYSMLANTESVHGIWERVNGVFNGDVAREVERRAGRR